jgi:ankyrin repeat protein
MYACGNGHTKVVAILLENKANIEAVDKVTKKYS